MKLAIVHDYLNQAGGAERVVKCFHEAFPDAPIYTSFYLPDTMPDEFKQMDIRTSFMQKLPGIKKHFKKYLALYPSAMASLDLSGYDLILSSSSAWAKGIRKPKDSCHLCYCHSPMRFVWMYDDYVKRERFGTATRTLLPLILKPIRWWDVRTNTGVDYFIANSKTTAKRIMEFYGRDSDVIHPPVDTSIFKPYNSKVKDYYLIVSRLNTYKKIDLAISAFNKLNIPLYIIGFGPDEERLRSIAGPNILFKGKLADDEVVKYYSECKALILSGIEDFGLTPVEAQACGRPVIAFRSGGALESIVESKTGVFFDEQTEASLISTVKKFETMSFESKGIRENALRFDKEVFKKKIRDYVQTKYKEHINK